MTRSIRAGTPKLAIWLSFCLGATPTAAAQTPPPSPIGNEAVMTTRATGTFEVTLTPAPSDDASPGPGIGRMSIDKRWHGDLEGTSRGVMLSAMTEVKGSAGYVAIERVTGTLKGKTGSFVLQHSGTMTRGAPQLIITVVPDSGTGELVGLTGTLTIIIADGKHSYEFDYSLVGAH